MKTTKMLLLVTLVASMLFAALPLAAQEERPGGPSYLFRLDYHYGEINPWLFYEKPLGKSVGLSAVFQMSTQGYAQIDIGPAFHIGNLALIPEFGIEFIESGDKGARIGHVSPEFFAFYNSPNWTFESQNLYFIKVEKDRITNYYYRHYLGHRLYKSSFLGPQVEGNVFLEAAPDHYFGGHLDIDVGVGLIGLFYGQNRDERGIFRMTFLRGF